MNAEFIAEFAFAKSVELAPLVCIEATKRVSKTNIAAAMKATPLLKVFFREKVSEKSLLMGQGGLLLRI